MSANLIVTRTYLEMGAPADLVPARAPDVPVRLDHVVHCPGAFYRFLYGEVGRAYRWIDRLSWSDEQVRAHLDRREVSVYVLYVEGAPGGYFELRRCDDGSTEVAYFGLMPDFIGRGLGGWLLGRAVEAAWAAGANRVWLHTCTLDHPSALPNYRKRGFRPVRDEQYEVPAVASSSA
jgi:GNAT superfamily N-acetyltransferase